MIKPMINHKKSTYFGAGGGLAKRLGAGLLAAVLTVGMLPSAEVHAEPAEEDVNFVMVMDVSGTMKTSDRNDYSKSALQMFVDMLPMESADAGVIAFGHSNKSDAYDFSEELAPSIEKHESYVHTISPLTDLSDEAAKKNLKTSIDNMKWNGDQTLIDAGLLGGVDMLAKAGTQPDQGCVIMLTDGEYMNYNEVGRDDEHDLAVAIDKLNDEGWSVYCIELDYANDPGKRDSAHAYLTGQITNHCNGETYQVSSAEDVSIAFMEIINNFYESGRMDSVTADSEGYAEYPLEIPALTSEANITVSGSSIQGITLTDGTRTMTSGDFDGDGSNETNYDGNSFVVSTGKIYQNIKMIVPPAGEWTLKVRADAGSEITINDISFSNFNLDAKITPEGTDETNALSKTDYIEAFVQMTYNGQILSTDSIGDAEGYLHITNETTGEVIRDAEMTWNEDRQGFEGSLSVNSLGRAGKLRVWAEIDYAGSKSVESEPTYIYTTNAPLQPIDNASITIEGYAGADMKPIEADKVFVNPDEDEVFFRYVPEGDPNSDVRAALSEDRKQIVITAGFTSGEYKGTLYVWDPDMGEDNALAIPTTISVRNHGMTMKEIGEIDMAKLGKSTLTIDLNEYFADEDQAQIPYDIDFSEEEKLFTIKTTDHTIELDSIARGAQEFTVAAVDNDGTRFEQTFTVKAALAEDIAAAKKASTVKTVVLLLLLAAVAAIILFVLRTLRALNTKMTGTWRITVSARGKQYSRFIYTDQGDVAMKNRRQASLWEILDPITFPNKEDAQEMKAILLPERELLRKLQIAALYKVQGCVLKSLDNRVEIVKGDKTVGSCELKRREAAVCTLKAEFGDIVVRIEI